MLIEMHVCIRLFFSPILLVTKNLSSSIIDSAESATLSNWTQVSGLAEVFTCEHFLRVRNDGNTTAARPGHW